MDLEEEEEEEEEEDEEEEEEEEEEIWSEEIKCRTVVDFGEEVRINVNISNLNSCLNFLSSFSKTRYAGQLLVSQNNLCTQLKREPTESLVCTLSQWKGWKADLNQALCRTGALIQS